MHQHPQVLVTPVHDRSRRLEEIRTTDIALGWLREVEVVSMAASSRWWRTHAGATRLRKRYASRASLDHLCRSQHWWQIFVPLHQLGIESQQLIKARQCVFGEVILDLCGEFAESYVVNDWQKLQ